jgi:hypothetical protein
VLFVCPRFFGYDDAIVAELQRRGASVDVLHDRPFDSPLMKALAKRAPGLVGRAAAVHYRGALDDSADYDLVFVINGQTLTRSFLIELRRRHTTAAFILYLWDSLANRSSIIRCIGLYDRVFSFDPNDAASYSLMYRPLFFSREFYGNKEGYIERSCDFDISFVGTAHTDRWSIIQQVDQSCPVYMRRYWFLYLQAKWVFHARRISDPEFGKARIEDFRFVTLPLAEVGRVFRGSRAILDIEHPSQHGLTMRTIEALGAGKKIVTTNTSIMECDFYRPSNVMILERGARLSLDIDFFRSPMERIPSEIYQRYSIEGWMSEILG